MPLLFQKKINRHIKHVYNTLPIEDWNSSISEPYCFYYNWCDQVYDIEFSDCLTDEQLNFLQVNPNIKLIYDFNGEPIESSTIEEIVFLFEKWKLNPRQLIITVSNKLQKEFIEKRFNNNNIIVVEYNYDIKHMKLSENKTQIDNKKFSVLCRLHRPWRSYMLCRLKEQNLLDNFHYSFMGCENDMTDAVNKSVEQQLDITEILATGNWKIINDPSRILNDLTTVCNYELSNEVIEFIELCPHYIEKENFKSDAETPNELFASDLHLVIENGFFDLEESKYNTRSVEMGEKTWKAIITSKPFLIYSDAGYLKNLKRLDFKTFSPMINEQYDDETDPKIRAELIIKEIERINALPLDQYTDLLKNCQEAVQHNYKRYIEIKTNTPEFTDIEFNNL
jgi:hypothetical protein